MWDDTTGVINMAFADKPSGPWYNQAVVFSNATHDGDANGSATTRRANNQPFIWHQPSQHLNNLSGPAVNPNNFNPGAPYGPCIVKRLCQVAGASYQGLLYDIAWTLCTW